MLAGIRISDPAPVIGVRKILVASDASASSDAAVLIARSLARANAASVDVITVFAPAIPFPAPGNRRGLAQCEASDRTAAASLVRAVRRQSRRLLPEPSERHAWSHRFEVGDPGAIVARLADELDADVVVLGIGQAEPADRRDTHLSLCAARYLTKPLIAATGSGAVPWRCIIAFPDGQVHAPTIRSAIACLAVDAHIWIMSPASPVADARNGIERASAEEMLACALGEGSADALRFMHMERVNSRGDMLADVLALAERVGADLIAVPNGGAPGAIRIFLPNLAEPLLLSARCSVLVVPDAPSNAAHP
jgi:nucleotide-binding universal stress UspA family protein